MGKGRIQLTCEEFKQFYQVALSAHLDTDDKFQNAIRNLNFKYIDGIAFEYSAEFQKANIKIAQILMKALGYNKVSLGEAKELTVRAMVDCIEDAREMSFKLFQEKLDTRLNNLSDNSFNYLGLCQNFFFDESPIPLVNKFVSVLPPDAALNTIDMNVNQRHWKIVAGEKFQSTHEEIHTQEIGPLCWCVRTETSKDKTADQARWMIEVFLSIIRLTIKPVDYCFRARLGEVEPIPTVSWQRKTSNQLLHSNERWHSESTTLEKMYRVDKRFASDFHSTETQATIDNIFTAKPKSLGERLRDGLIWLSRGRQSGDVSERLLYTFTALEAVFSEKSAFSPTADTIARLVSVILSQNSNSRFASYSELKRLYNLRSALVHRGQRSANEIDANNLQQVAESCYFVLLKTQRPTTSHAIFMEELKKASHGGEWPQKLVVG